MEFFERIAAQVTVTRNMKTEVVEHMDQIQDSSSSKRMQAIEKRMQTIEEGQTTIVELLHTIHKDAESRSCTNNM
jgi:hypothetical protein